MNGRPKGVSNPRFDVGRLVRRAVRERGQDIAVVCDGRSRTYAQLGDRAERLACAIRGLGLGRGERVAVLLSNRLEYPEVDVGLAFGGLVRVALNVRLGTEDLSYILEDSTARVILTEERYDEVAAELVERHDLLWIRMGPRCSSARSRDYETLLETSRPEVVELSLPDSAPAWISYTSGTTGRPKGVVLSHRALVQVGFNLMVELGPVTAGSSILLPQPLSHGAGYFVLPYLAAGAITHIMGKFDPHQALEIGRRHRIGILKCVPTMVHDLLETGESIPFGTVIYGAAPMSRRQMECALERYGPVLVQVYGQSEAPVTITVLHKHDFERPGPHLRSAGRPWRTVDVEVVDPDGRRVADGELGEVVVVGPHLMDGYSGQPDLTAEVLRDGRLWTRDMAIRDDRGYIYLRGRRDEMINSGGYNIAPKEIEDAVAEHPAVEECIAVGLLDERWGQAVQVHVQVSNGAAVDAEELIQFCEPTLGFRRPRSIVFTDDLPRTAYGKLDRSKIKPIAARAQHGEGDAA